MAGQSNYKYLYSIAVLFALVRIIIAATLLWNARGRFEIVATGFLILILNRLSRFSGQQTEQIEKITNLLVQVSAHVRGRGSISLAEYQEFEKAEAALKAGRHAEGILTWGQTITQVTDATIFLISAAAIYLAEA